MNDLISRQDAIGAIVNTVSKVGNHDNSEVARYGATFRQHEIIDILNGLPPAQPERKTGKWGKDRRASLNGGSYEVFVCSECESAFNWRMRYCGHCGCKMGVEK